MKKLILVLIPLLFFMMLNGQRQTEKLDRGLVAIKISEGVFVGWRITGLEWMDVSFNIYRNGTKVNAEPLEGPSNYMDSGGSAGDKYAVAAVISGVEQALSQEVTARNNAYYNIPINRPPGGTSPDGAYTYSANDASAGDLDGDGDMEIILKWDPSNSHDNAHSGYTGDVIIDAYTMAGTHLWRVNLGRNIRAGAHYTQFMVADFDGDGKAEMACKTADGTVDGLGTVIGNPDADYRNSEGRILSGPEFLTMFNGETGEAMHTIDYQPARGSVGIWGDTYGNRVDRFLACVPYLDGEHPSLVMARGYYERTMLAAYDWKDGELSMRWLFNSEAGGLTEYSGQGNHNLSVADVDNDGKDEIIYGAMTLDDDGTGLYSTGLYHGDALHVSDLDPDYPGLEVFSPHEAGDNGVTFREAATGKIIWQHRHSDDVGRGVAADILSNKRGFESWASSGLGMYNAQGILTGSIPNSINFRIWWDGDLQSELLDGTSIREISTTIMSASSVSSNNGSKSTPTLSADLFGDWREEVIWRYYDNTMLRVFTTTDVTNHKLYSLLHDSQYRSAIAWQNVAYNQPPHASFFMETDMALPVPLVFSGSKWKGSSGANNWNLSTANFLSDNGSQTSFINGDTAIFSFNGIHNEPVNLTEDIAPGLVVIASPDDYNISGEGSLTGTMNLYKTQKGAFLMTGTHTYSGKTIVTDGALVVNGSLENSKVLISGGAWGGKNAGMEMGGRLGGSGHLKGGVEVQTRGVLLPGMLERDTLFIENGLEIHKRGVVYFDLSSTAKGQNDMIIVNGDLSFGTGTTLKFNLVESVIDTGTYVLFTYTGTLSGSIEGLEITGLDGFYYELKDEGGSITLRRPPSRNPGTLAWTGSESNVWALSGALNWQMNSEEEFFLPQDSVYFGETGVSQTNIDLQGVLNIADMTIHSSLDYFLTGEGGITGPGGILKKGSGKFKLLTSNSFTGKTIIEDGGLLIDKLQNGDQVSNIGMAGSDPSALQLNGGELIIWSSAASDKGMLIGEGGGALNIRLQQELNGDITGTGPLEKSGNGSLIIPKENNSFSGDVLISGGTVRFMSDEANASGLGSGKITIQDGTISFNDSRNTYNSTALDIHIPEDGQATLIMDGRVFSNDHLTGAGKLNVQVNYVRSEFDGDWSGFSGHINVLADNDGGDFRVNNSYGYEASSMTFNDNLYAYHLEDETIAIGSLESLPGSVMRSGIWKIGSKNEESVLNGDLDGDKLIKVGDSRLTINGNENTYSGGTEVEAGTLWVTNTGGSATGSGDVLVKADAVLGGDGIIEGKVVLESAAVLSPGIDIGTITINNEVNMQANSILNIDLSNENGSNDLLKADQIILNDPTLYMLNNSGEQYQKGDRFKILETDKIQGIFSAIYPKQPAEGLAWDTTNLYTFGLIEVVEIESDISLVENQDLAMIYPNPTSKLVYIAEGKWGETVKKITLLSSTGAALNVYYPGRHEIPFEIDLTGKPAGLYFIKIDTENATISKKLVLNSE